MNCFRYELIAKPEHFIDFFTAVTIYKFFGGPIRSFYIRKEKIFLLFHILQLVESAPFIFLKPEKARYPFRVACPHRPLWGEPPCPNRGPRVFNLLEDFKNLSGLVINSSKNEAMWIVSSKGKNPRPFAIKWPDEPIKTLRFKNELFHILYIISLLTGDMNSMN